MIDKGESHRPLGPDDIAIRFEGGNSGARIHEVKRDGTVSIFLGDIVYRRRGFADVASYLESVLDGFKPEKLRHMPGFFYLIQACPKERWIRVFSSVFSILPVYYHQHDGVTHIASSLRSIRKVSPARLTPSPLFLLEKCLFNYALFNETWFSEVKLLASNSYLHFQEGLKVIRHACISDHYAQAPARWQDSLDDLSDRFISAANDHLPASRFIATLTGGFDSRTIVGVALNAGKEFSTYSYGGTETDDVLIPRRIADELGFEHRIIPIDEEYAAGEYWRHALEFVRKSEGGGNISRSHYSFAAKILGKEADCLVSGNFGSEIIRAMKSPGVMVPQPVFDIFEISDLLQLKNAFKHNPGLRYLQTGDFDEALEKLMDEISMFRAGLPTGLTTNQQFYIYMFEEVFRKYFGPEILAESGALRHRAPFIDFSFVEAMLKTDLAGVYSRFRESNPFKRFHGQVLYAHIMRKTCPKLLDILLDRNYYPRDFLSPFGHARITAGYFAKKITTRKQKASPAYSSLCLHSSREQIQKLEWNREYFDREYFRAEADGGWMTDQEIFTNMVSAAIYFNELFPEKNSPAENPQAGR